MSAAIEVLEVHAVTGNGNLQAFAKIRIGCVVIHGCRVIQQDGQRPWVSLPQTRGDRWFPVVEITRRELLDQVCDAVLQAWEASR